MGIFEQTVDDRSYKRVILSQIQDASVRGYQGQLSKLICCQPSNFSSVLNLHRTPPIHLTPDQIFVLGNHFGFSRLEKDIFLLQLHFARSTNEDFREETARAIKEKVSEMEETKSVAFDARALDGEKKIKYYSHWEYTAVHMLIHIEQYGTRDAIAQKLGIPTPWLDEILSDLMELGLISSAKGTYFPLENNIHLDGAHWLEKLNHRNFRHRAIQAAMVPKKDSLHYTSMATINEADFQKIRLELLHVLKKARETCLQSPSEKAICLAVDLFGV